MCHPLLISHVDLKISPDKKRSGVMLESEVKLEGKTGVEMEALSAVSIAALTVYDMCKAVDKDMIIEDKYRGDWDKMGIFNLKMKTLHQYQYRRPHQGNTN